MRRPRSPRTRTFCLSPSLLPLHTTQKDWDLARDGKWQSMWQLRKPTVAQGWRSPLGQQVVGESAVVVCSAGLTFWQGWSLASLTGSSPSESDPRIKKPLGDTGVVSVQPHVERCADAEENGQLFSDRVPKYIAFILQGVIKLWPSLPSHEAAAPQRGAANLCGWS